MFFRETGLIDAPAYRLEHLLENTKVHGPAIVDSNFTTIVINPGAHAVRRAGGHLVVRSAA